MPLTRSGSVRSKTTGESSVSTDWSMNTPSEETTSASTTTASVVSRSTITKRTPPPSIQGSQSTAHQTRDTAAEKESTIGEATHTAPLTRTIEERTETSNSARHEERPMLQNLDKSVAVKIRRNEGSAPTSREGSPQRPHTKGLTRDMDTMSIRSSHRRKAEAQARLTIALRELELAEARSRVAQAELELAAAESEEEDGAGEELFERTQEVEKWIIQTGVKPSKVQKKADKEEKKSDIQELAQVIVKPSEKSRDITPKHLDLPYFNGTCEEWLAFKRSMINDK